MPPDHAGLSSEDLLAHGGWHPRYVRVLAVASDGDYGFALVDGNGDGAELEEEAWQWHNGAWQGNSSSGAGSLSTLGLLQTGGQIDNAYFAFGKAPGRQSVTISFDGRLHHVPVNVHGIWAFIKVHTDPDRGEPPSLEADHSA